MLIHHLHDVQQAGCVGAHGALAVEHHAKQVSPAVLVMLQLQNSVRPVQHEREQHDACGCLRTRPTLLLLLLSCHPHSPDGLGAALCITPMSMSMKNQNTENQSSNHGHSGRRPFHSGCARPGVSVCNRAVLCATRLISQDDEDVLGCGGRVRLSGSRWHPALCPFQRKSMNPTLSPVSPILHSGQTRMKTLVLSLAWLIRTLNNAYSK